jgi:type II secretory pathway component PulK
MKLVSSQKGSTFIIVIMVLSIMLIMAGTMAGTVNSELKTSSLYNDGVRAYFIAESGIAEAMDWVKSDNKTNYNKPVENNLFSPNYSKTHSLKWEVEYNNVTQKYTINSAGIYYSSSNIPVTRKLTAVVSASDGNVYMESLNQQ